MCKKTNKSNKTTNSAKISNMQPEFSLNLINCYQKHLVKVKLAKRYLTKVLDVLHVYILPCTELQTCNRFWRHGKLQKESFMFSLNLHGNDKRETIGLLEAGCGSFSMIMDETVTDSRLNRAYIDKACL